MNANKETHSRVLACISGTDALAGRLHLLFLRVLRVLSGELSLPHWRLLAFIFSEKK